MIYECRFDGNLTEYVFGAQGVENWKFESPSLARAVRAFRVGVLHPHAHCSGRIKSKVPGDGCDHLATRYLSSKPGSTIEVRVHVERDHQVMRRPFPDWDERPEWESAWHVVAEIPPEDPEAEWHQNMLPAAVAAAAAGVPEGDDSTALARASSSTGLAITSRATMVEKELELQRMMADVERARNDLQMQKREMEAQIVAMKVELKRRMEQIWFIELFLGSKEQVVLLRDGEPAPADRQISVYQQVLCMDEEVAVWTWVNELEKIAEFEHKDLEDFDAWLLRDPTHLDSILPAEKGIRALRVRRQGKPRLELGDDLGAMYQRIELEQLDKMVYLLVRNGEQLYRLWVDVDIWPRFFPRKNEWDWVERPDRHYVSPFNKDEATEQAKRFLAGLVVVQGLCQRSDILHPIPAEVAQLDIFDPFQVERHFDCVRDDEVEGLIGDGSTLGRLTWAGYKTWLKEQLADGVRVFFDGEDGDKLSERVYMDTVSGWPRTDTPYTIRDEKTKASSSPSYSFLYLPGDDVSSRAKRVRFFAYKDELWPVDFISWRVVEHLLLDRGQRSHYASFFRLFADWYKGYKASGERERPFVDLVLMQCGVVPLTAPAADRARAERLLRWWKVKTKQHRDLGTDESKALRMVVAAFKRGDDGPDDPEVDLFKELER